MAGNHGVFGREPNQGGTSLQTVHRVVNDAIDELRAELNASMNQVPVGAILPYGSATAPDGYLVCDGAAVSRDTYADLYAVIGTSFGAGDGSTTFNLPDLQGRAPLGSGTGSGLTSRTLGSKLGAETHTLTEGEMPAHSHSTSAWGSASSDTHDHSLSASTGSDSHGHSVSGSAGSAGGHSHSYQGADFVNGAAAGSDSAAATGEPTESTSTNGAHTHSVSGSTDSDIHSHTVSGTIGSDSHSHSVSVSVSLGSAGSGTAHNNLGPSTVTNFIIRAAA